MTELYASATGSARRAGQCSFIWHWEDVDLNCPKAAIPGGPECDDHLIARVAAEPAPAALPWRRWFKEPA